MGVVYILEDPRETEPKKRDRYVGKSTKTTHIRLQQHIAEAQAGKQTHRCKCGTTTDELIDTLGLPTRRVQKCSEQHSRFWGEPDLLVFGHEDWYYDAYPDIGITVGGVGIVVSGIFERPKP